MTVYRCIDGYCGAFDCVRCHPEGDDYGTDEDEMDDEPEEAACDLAAEYAKREDRT